MIKHVHSTAVAMAATGLVVAAAFALTGCAGAQAAASPAASPDTQAMTASSAAPIHEDGVFVGPTSGKSADPALAAWQTRILHALGRDDQYCLFNYAAVDGAVYMALDYSRFNLSETELATTSDILAQQSDSLRAGMTRDNFWLMPVTASGTGDSRSALWISE